MLKNKISAIVISVLMILSAIPATVFASEVTPLSGDLKVKGVVAEGQTLSADFSKVTPEGITEDDVTYLWSRKTADDEQAEQNGEEPELKELSKEKTYTVTAEDIGSKIVLTITGKEDQNYSGSIKVVTAEVVDAATGETMQQGEGTDSTDQSEETSDQTESGDQTEETSQPESTDQTEPTNQSENTEDNSEAGSESVGGIPEAKEDGTYNQDSDSDSADNEENDDNKDSSDDNAGSDSNDNDSDEVVVEAKVTVGDGSSDTLDFGSITEGEEAAVETQYITITNTGTTNLNFEKTSPKNFKVQDITTTLKPGESTAPLWVVPRENIASGEYEETITYITTEGATVSFNAKITVNKAAESEEKVSNVTLSSSQVNFANLTEGYSADQITAQTVTFTNTGTADAQLSEAISDSGNHFDIRWQAQTVSANGGTALFSIQPKSGLSSGVYSEAFTVTDSASGNSYVINATIQIIKKSVSLTKIQQPAAITGLPYGTKKDASSLGLPGTVTIEITDGTTSAAVTWDVNGCSYNPSNTNAQKFTVSGTVVLPTGIDNKNNVSLATSVEVNVGAYSPKNASADDNEITGIEYNGEYTTQSKISFTAVGAGMDNNSPKKGDTRYVPQTWTVINTNGWSKEPYTATFGLSQSGDYTLKVNFGQQKYDGSAWNYTGTTDTKQVPFKITNAKVTAPGTDLTPAASKTKSVRTGDNTPIKPFICLLIIAAGAISGVIIYKKKNK